MFSSFSTSSLSFSSSNSKPTYFDQVIGALEEIITSDEFSDSQQEFLDENCDGFDETSDENKLEYTQTFKKYEELGETLLIKGLKSKLGSEFDFSKFKSELDKNKSEDLYEITEMLDCFCDFMSFKQLMTDHKRAKRGDFASLENCLLVSTNANFMNDGGEGDGIDEMLIME